jgi:hypothetical protein
VFCAHNVITVFLSVTIRASGRLQSERPRIPEGSNDRQPKRSKNAARVDRKLEAPDAASAEGANVTEVASKTEEAVKGATETAETTAQPPQAGFSRGQLGKAKRAFAKAGQAEASEEVRKGWLAEMKEAGVAVMNFTSNRLAKVIKGEITISELQK